MRISKPPLQPRAPRSQMRREDAESIAISALSHIAGDEERLQRFLAVTGLDPANLRSEAANLGFMSGILDYVCSDEALLIGFAAEHRLPPERVAMAQQLLAGPSGGDW
jgi:hypothetical protein